jgi:PKD repeat protein
MKILKGTLALLLVGTVACGGEPLQPLTLAITIEANPIIAAPGQEVTFEIAAQGGQLMTLVVNYGDDSSREEPLRASRTAEATFRHAYTAPGVYTVTATVADAEQGSKEAQTSVDVR